MRVAASIASAAWLSSNIADCWRYRLALAHPVATQEAVLRQYLRANAATRFGRRYGFASIRTVEEYQAMVPLASYSAFEESIDDISRGQQRVLTRDPVRTLGLSSGSVSAAKRIPYTRVLQKEFRRAISPWVVDLYRRHPALAAGCSYWSITPVASDRTAQRSAVPVGFEEDSEYLGAACKRFVDATLAVPGAVRFIPDIEAFRYVTLLFLLRRPDLRLVSVWHPSFLTLLLGSLPSHWDSLRDDVRRGTLSPPAALSPAVERDLRPRLKPDRRRAEELKRIRPGDCASLWPALRLVSCWADGHAALNIPELRTLLPRAEIQPKGLLATEAVVTVPFRGKTPLAVRSHFFEFLRDGRACLPHELVAGNVYSVVVTTGGGLYRYRLEDRVEVDGFVEQTPSLKFLGKEDHVSDLCGEKLNETFVARALSEACACAETVPRFALVAPDLAAIPPGYTLYLESDAPPPAALRRKLEELLLSNPNYRYCRTLGQLAPARVFHTRTAMFPRYLQRCLDMGQRLGDVKPLALSSRGGWSDVFRGRYQTQE
jgi:hypothetical protein